jgi:acetolactate synthase-1/2/3 large subunit
MNVAEVIARACSEEDVRLAAGIAGGHVGPLLDALGRHEQIKLVYARQERVAVDIADGFARASGRPGIAFADSGPAVANVMGGLVNSWSDGTPVLLLAGQPELGVPRRRDTKEIPFLELFSPVAKWAAMIEHPDHVEEIMRRAFMQLTSGRPGPVVIGVPHDVQAMAVRGYGYKPVSSLPRLRCGADPAGIAAAVEMIAGAQRPYLYAGAGVLFSDASPELIELAELLTLPCATTLNGKSAFPEDHPLALGLGGFARAHYNPLPAAEIARGADVILAVGCGFKAEAMHERPPSSARLIQIDIEPSEINRAQLADIALQGDAKMVLGQMIAQAKATLPAARRTPVRKRIAVIEELRDRWAEVSQPLLASDETPINPFRVTAELMRLTRPGDTVVLHDASSVRGTVGQHYIATRPRGFIGFGTQSSMGWSLGAAIGAKTAHPDKLVIALIGEEAVQETAVDIETSVRNDAPVLLIVKNNSAASREAAARNPRLTGARYSRPVEIGPLALALGAQVVRIERPGEIAAGLEKAIAQVRSGRTTVVEVVTARANADLRRLWDKTPPAGAETARRSGAPLGAGDGNGNGVEVVWHREP